MVEVTNKESGHVVLKSVDGHAFKVNLEIAYNQSSFIADYIENEKSEYENQFGDTDGLVFNEVQIDLENRQMMTSSMLEKIIEFWVYVETKCQFPEIKKPLTTI